MDEWNAVDRAANKEGAGIEERKILISSFVYRDSGLGLRAERIGAVWLRALKGGSVVLRRQLCAGRCGFFIVGCSYCYCCYLLCG